MERRNTLIIHVLVTNSRNLRTNTRRIKRTRTCSCTCSLNALITGENRKNECVLFSCVCVYSCAITSALNKTCACVGVAGVNKSLLRAMFCCVGAFRAFIWFTQVVGLQSKQHGY